MFERVKTFLYLLFWYRCMKVVSIGYAITLVATGLAFLVSTFAVAKLVLVVGLGLTVVTSITWMNRDALERSDEFDGRPLVGAIIGTILLTIISFIILVVSLLIAGWLQVGFVGFLVIALILIVLVDWLIF